MFIFLWVMGLFLRSKAPGLVFSVPYQWGSLAPSAFSSTSLSAMSSRPNGSELRLPPQIRHEKGSGLRFGRARHRPPVTSEGPHNPRACWHAM
jgi:hypothetical protein